MGGIVLQHRTPGLDPGSPLCDHSLSMQSLVHGWGFTIGALVLITGTFVAALQLLGQQLRSVKALADYLSYDLAVGGAEGNGDSAAKPSASLVTERIRDQVSGVANAADPAWAHKQVRGWQMEAQRLEPALAFWVDLLRQMGLLFTVLGLGLSLTLDTSNVQELLRPLGLAVWTTVAGLFFSLVLTARFGMKVAVWADTCEKNIEAWDRRRRGVHGSEGAS
jgi:hypothetical protein